MRAQKLLMIYILSIAPVLIFCLTFIISGNITLKYSGFGVDSAGNFYIGKDGIKGKGGIINIYSNDKYIGSIDPPTSRAYLFTVSNDDTILLSTGAYVYKMDLYGNLLSKEEDMNSHLYTKLQFQRKFICGDGNEYIIKSLLGRTVIYSENRIIFKMPLLDYAIKIIYFLCFPVHFIMLAVIIVKWRKQAIIKTGDG